MNKDAEVQSGYSWLRSEGLSIHYYHARPQTGGPFPLILLNHGGGGFDVFYEQLTRFLARQGYAVAAMAFRGYPPSQGQQEYGDGEVTDLINLIALLQEDRAIDMNRVGTLGNSRGGLYALLLSSACDTVRSVVAWSAPVEMFQHYQLHPELLEITIGGCPQNMPEQYRKRSVLYEAGNISAPVLLVHGKDDDVVPVWHACSMYTALKENGKNVELALLENEGHNLTAKGVKSAVGATLNFFKKTL